jgi:mitogen-activated protein kinase kinase
MSESILPPRTLARRNFKKLSLPPKAEEPSPTVRATAGDSNDQEDKNIVKQLASLELGVEFNLNLREEDFKKISDLGSGNGGIVSKVMHVPTNTVMAKKIVNLETRPAVRKQIVRELHIMHDCDSENIVSYYGGYATESSVIMCMEYMDCGSLDRISKKVGPISEEILGKITEAVVNGLVYLYNEHRIIHRDVKPSNVLVNSKGQIKLCDFGVSGELINSIADTFVGTSTYMSPERIQGAAYSVKSDVWSLGITVLELAIGKTPFDTNDKMNGGGKAGNNFIGILDVLQRIVNEEPPQLPEDQDFSANFRKFISKCLFKEERRPSPQDLLNDAFFLTARQSLVDVESWARPFKIPE